MTSSKNLFALCVILKCLEMGLAVVIEHAGMQLPEIATLHKSDIARKKLLRSNHKRLALKYTLG